MDEILRYAHTARLVKEGIMTAIIGRPNVGKSSLLNALLRENKAIVTNIAGTTRDLVEGSLHVGGITLNLVDTAGIHETEDLIEKIGVEKSRQAIEKAELVLLVLDGSEPLTDEDFQLMEMVKNKKHIKVINKMDLELKINLAPLGECLLISTSDYNSIHSLEKAILGYININELNATDMTYVSNARHISLIEEARKSLLESMQAIRDEVPIDFIDIYLQQAWRFLGEILGEVHDDDLINELFTRFCLGK
jgi:tRNA modification GTPase